MQPERMRKSHIVIPVGLAANQLETTDQFGSSMNQDISHLRQSTSTNLAWLRQLRQL